LRELLEAQRNRKREQLSKGQLALFEAAQARNPEDGVYPEAVDVDRFHVAGMDARGAGSCALGGCHSYVTGLDGRRQEIQWEQKP